MKAKKNCAIISTRKAAQGSDAVVMRKSTGERREKKNIQAQRFEEYERSILRALNKRRMTSTKWLALGYVLIIAIGTGLLMLPAACRPGEITSFKGALFTATSAACVTGLSLYDTYTHWSAFGQVILLVLIQIGGIGFITLAISAISLTKKKIGMRERFLIQESVAAPQVGGVVKMAKFIVVAALTVELCGAVLLSFVFVPQMGWMGVWFAVFHSVSAFCNAGFDLMGYFEPGSSLATFAGSWYVNAVIMLLIIMGGIGFFVWIDAIKNRLRIRRYSLQSKMVLTMSGALILLGAAAIFAIEYGGSAFAGKSFGEKALLSLFQSVSPRTAGFASMELIRLSPASRFVMIVLMAIGGSTGSTAGGIKTNTIMVLLLSIFAQYRKKRDIELFGRRVDSDTLRQASCVLMLFLTTSFLCTVVISAIEPFALDVILFEVVSALGTVGLTLGVTAQLSTVSHVILIMLMFVGRVGSITVLLAFSSGSLSGMQSKYPLEKVNVG